MNCREMTHGELKIEFSKKSIENENLKITNELLLDNIKRLREQVLELEQRNNELIDRFSSIKEQDVERKKERIFNND